MKKLAGLLTFLLLLVGASFGQSMVPQARYYQYTTRSYNKANHRLTQTITVEGTTVGSCNFPSCINATHSSMITNTLVVNGTTHGGNHTFGPYSPWNFFTNTVSTDTFLPIGGIATSKVEGYVLCTVAGYVFSSIIWDYIEATYTLEKYVSTARVYQSGPGVTAYDVNVIDWCTPATTPPDFSNTFLGGVGSITPFYQVIGICTRPTNSGPWGPCHGVSIDDYINKAAPRASCTKNP